MTTNLHVRPEDSGASDSATERWAHLVQQTTLGGRQLRRLLASLTGPWNITDTEFLLLWACNQSLERGLRQNDLIHMLGVSPAQMSGLVYDLRDRGLLTFERPPHDRRRQIVKVTGQGRLLLQRVLESLTPLVQRLEKLLSREDQCQLETLLDRLIQAAESVPEPQANRLPAEPSSISLTRRAS